MIALDPGSSIVDQYQAEAASTNVVPYDTVPALRPSRLARQLSTRLVKGLDESALLWALFLMLTIRSHQRSLNVGSFLALLTLRNVVLALALSTVWRLSSWVAGLYQAAINYRLAVLLWKLPLASILCVALMYPILWKVEGDSSFNRSSVLLFAFTLTFLLVVRAAAVTFEEHIRPLFRPERTVIVCGTGPLAQKQIAALSTHPRYRYNLLGLADDNAGDVVGSQGKVLCSFSNLENVLMQNPVDEVIVGLPLKSHFAQVQEIVAMCGRAGVEVQYSLDLFNTDVTKRHKTDGDQTHSVVLEMVHRDQRLLFKSLMDQLAAAVGLIVSLPLLVVIASAIKLSSPGPIFFVQERFGMGKRRFGIIKFRSMVVNAEVRQISLEHMNETSGPMFKMKHDPRMTRVGAFLRRTSLDELPQLINVLKGDMSLVGPRPLSTRDVLRFNQPWFMRRFSVKPGITGLWQVSGRSNMNFDTAIKLDLQYIDRWSLLLDLHILLRTVRVVVGRTGAY